MPQLIAHLVGDYVLQSHWMAQNKVKAWLPAIIHVALYSILFLFLADNWRQMAVISGTHLLIDRFRLAKYWVEWWGVGCSGSLWKPRWFYDVVCSDGGNGKTNVTFTTEDHPLWEQAPPWLGVWLLIIVDNTMHLAINWAALEWL